MIIKEFGSNIQHIAGVDKIVDDMIISLPPSLNEEVELITIRDQYCANNLFENIQEEIQANGFPLDISFVKRGQKISGKQKI